MASRISEIFFYQESGKGIFFIKNPKKKKKKKKFWRVGGEGVEVARVSDFFFKRIQV